MVIRQTAGTYLQKRGWFSTAARRLNAFLTRHRSGGERLLDRPTDGLAAGVKTEGDAANNVSDEGNHHESVRLVDAEEARVGREKQGQFQPGRLGDCPPPAAPPRVAD